MKLKKLSKKSKNIPQKTKKLKENFWFNLKKPFFVLAPMADVTDCAFREVITKCGKPDVLWTEFVSADGLCLAPKKSRYKILKDLIYSEKERPIVAQLFSSKPEYMYKASLLIKKLGFDGIDINMGCPDKTIEKQGSGAGLIKNPKLAREIIRSAKKSGLPVSVKTRVGYHKDELETWLPELLKERPSVITIHARTRKEMSKVPADWNRITKAVLIRNKINQDLIFRNEKPLETLIIGNGDVLNIEQAHQLVNKTKCDGVMLGRAIFGNPWLFNKNFKSGTNVSIKEKLETMLKQTILFEKKLGDVKSFSVMKKHYKAYVNGFNGAKELRVALMDCQNAKEVKKIIKDFLNNKINEQ